MTIQQPHPEQRKTLLVPFDFSAHAHAALEAAAGLAEPLHADIQLLHVVQPPAYTLGGASVNRLDENADSMSRREAVARDLNAMARAIEERVDRVGLEVVEGSRPDRVIREYADRVDADMIVMGTHGHTGLAQRFLGGVTERMLHDAPCPVLSVQSSAESASGSKAPSALGHLMSKREMETRQ